MSTGPERILLSPDGEDTGIEVSQETQDALRRAHQAKAIREARQLRTRRSWYTSAAAADAFSAVVDDIHHATRVPKHEVVAALFEAAVEQAAAVEKRLSPRIAPMRPVRGISLPTRLK